MYTTDCKDPNCYKCKQALEGQSSGEEVRNKFVKTVEELISTELVSASVEKAACLKTFRKLKDEVHCKINGLIDILRERERGLCIQLEQEYAAQATKIDHDVTTKCINKLLLKNNVNEKAPGQIQLVLHSDFDVLKRKLQNFGCLKYEHISELAKTELLKGHETCINLEKSQRDLCADEVNFITKSSIEKISPTTFASPLVVDSEATPISAENDEDDIEFINSNEAADIPSGFPFIPSLPSKGRFRFCRKRPFFASFLPKKEAFSSEKDSKSGSSDVGENEYDGCSVTLKSSVSSGSNIENASINERAEREFCSFVSSDEGCGQNPSAILLSSFRKYLQKNPESEWLAPEKNSEQLSSGNNCISYKPFVVKKDVDLHEWLSKKDNI